MAFHVVTTDDGGYTTIDDIMRTMTKELEGKGLELYPFKIQWYNDQVKSIFHLPYHGDTLAVLIISTPPMFELLLKPFILNQYDSSVKLDPVDHCFKLEFMKLKESLSQRYSTEFIQDYELLPNRRPKILLQTAGHVSGAAYYYQRNHVKDPPWKAETNIYGVSVHPVYGGWFAFRGVFIFQDVLVSNLERKEPVNCVTSRERVIELLEKFNYHWQDWNYRDVLDWEIKERYSTEQREYFATPPKDRHRLVQTKWLSNIH